MSYTQSVYHTVFSTKLRYPTIPETYERDLYKILFDLMTSYGAHVYRIGGISDHIHLLVDISSKNSLSGFVQKLKQESSFILARDDKFSQWSGWGEGYGAFTLSVKEIPIIQNYIRNQKEHHKHISFIDEYKAWLIDNGISPDTPYFPK